MDFEILSTASKALLDDIIQAENPTQMICNKLANSSRRGTEELRGLLRELVQKNYINIKWADNMPYHVFIHNSARTYNNHLSEQERQSKRADLSNEDDDLININSIYIGNGNKIQNSSISTKCTDEIIEPSHKNKSFYDRHPAICGLLISLAAGIILLFSFWKEIVNFIEGVF